MKKNLIRIATRKSPLALWQAEFIRQALLRIYPEIQVELIGLLTEADKLPNVSLFKIGGKGLFVKELEIALLEHHADIAVHSLKDLPAELPDGLMLATFCEREDARDVFVSSHFASLNELPLGACAGTSSLRRQCQIQAMRPDLKCESLRGNVDTRLHKLDEGQFDAIILAAAGLKRLGKEERIRQYFAIEELLPAVGQGAIVIECRAADVQVRECIAMLDHLPTRYCVTAERAMNYVLNGGCQVPIAAHATLLDKTVYLQGLVGMPDGKKILKCTISGHQNESEAIGKALAQDLIAQGADKILQNSN
ncbi:MAG: hydroxymethylbilane synthase [Gammaproteobacteria bacterium]